MSADEACEAIAIEAETATAALEELPPIASDAHFLRVGFTGVLDVLSTGLSHIVRAIYAAAEKR